MAREQQRESATSSGSTTGNGGTETGYRAETRQSRQGNGGSQALERSARHGALQQATRGWPGLLGRGIPASPWELVRRMSDEMNQLFESLGGTGAGPAGLDRRRGAGESPLLIPRTEVVQQPDALLIRVEMPGMAADEIEITVENGVLTVAGERRQEDREEGDGFVRSELVYGTFFRTIPLPDGADEDNIIAVVRNGVLEITVPISKQEQGKRVNVQAGDTAGSARSALGQGGTGESSTAPGSSSAGGGTGAASGSGTESSRGGSSRSGSATSGSGTSGAGSSRGE
jgi:HSP20 family protein